MGNWILIGLVLALIILIIFAKFYHRSSKDIAFVRTGLGGERVVLTGGALSIPIVHQITPVNMSSLRLDVERSGKHGLITKDHMRVDLESSFYMRVSGTRDAVALAAQTLGGRTLNQQAIQDLFEGKLVDALRSAVAEMTLDDLHSQGRAFVERVRSFVNDAGVSNGLELEYVSLSRLDQTAKAHFDPTNTFDAHALVRITREAEESRRTRNEIEKAAETKIQDTNLAAEEKALSTKRGSEYAKLQTDLDIAQRRAEQSSLIARVQAEQIRASAEVEVQQQEAVSKLRLVSEQLIEQERIRKDQEVRRAEIDKARLLEVAEIERERVLKIASEETRIALLSKQRERAIASQATSDAEAAAAAAIEAIETAHEMARAERDRGIYLVRAERIAREKAIGTTIIAEAEKEAALNIAEARRITASADAAANEMRMIAEADGRRRMNEAANMLSEDQIAMQLRMAVVQALPEIIRESVKPMENIDNIKIIDLQGVSGRSDGGRGDAPSESGDSAPGNDDMIDRLVGGALRYRMQAPVVDSLLREVGLADGNGGLEDVIKGQAGILGPNVPKPTPPQRSITSDKK